MSEVQEVLAKKGTGMIAGLLACVLAILGILFLGFIFVPIAAIVALLGIVIAVKNKNTAGISVNILAWVLVIVGLFSSPVLLLMIGVTSSGVASSMGDSGQLPQNSESILPNLGTENVGELQKLTENNIELLAGEWVGKYRCSQGETGLTLNIVMDKGISAIFKFYSLEGNPQIEGGSFSMTGNVENDGTFVLLPKSWIKKPRGFSMISMRGVLDKSEKNLRGKVIFPGCSSFELQKTSE